MLCVSDSIDYDDLNWLDVSSDTDVIDDDFMRQLDADVTPDLTVDQLNLSDRQLDVSDEQLEVSDRPVCSSDIGSDRELSVEHLG